MTYEPVWCQPQAFVNPHSVFLRRSIKNDFVFRLLWTDSFHLPPCGVANRVRLSFHLMSWLRFCHVDKIPVPFFTPRGIWNRFFFCRVDTKPVPFSSGYAAWQWKTPRIHTEFKFSSSFNNFVFTILQFCMCNCVYIIHWCTVPKVLNKKMYKKPLSVVFFKEIWRNSS